MSGLSGFFLGAGIALVLMGIATLFIKWRLDRTTPSGHVIIRDDVIVRDHDVVIEGTTVTVGPGVTLRAGDGRDGKRGGDLTIRAGVRR